MLVHPDAPFQEAVRRHRQRLDAAAPAGDRDRTAATALLAALRLRPRGPRRDAAPARPAPAPGVQPVRP